MDDIEDQSANDENPSEFIKRAAEEREMRLHEEAIRQQMIQKQMIQDLVDRKIREKNKKLEKNKKIKTIEDVLKRGKTIRWEIVNHSLLKGFVKDKLVFEVRRGLTIFNLYVKDKAFVVEDTKLGYVSCSFNLDTIKVRAEKILIT
jgi:hypothetical protein